MADLAAGRRSMSKEPRTFSAACDVGMTSIAHRRRWVPQKVLKKAPKTTPKLVQQRRNKAVVEDEPCWEWIQVSAGGRMRDSGSLELRGTTSEPLEIRPSSHPSTGCYTLRCRCRRLGWGDGSDERFYVRLGKTTVGVDWNDAVLVIDVDGRRVRTVPEAGFATAFDVPMIITVRGPHLTVDALDAHCTVQTSGSGIGLVVRNTRIAVDHWSITDHHAVAVNAARAASDAAMMFAKDAAAAVHLITSLSTTCSVPDAAPEVSDDDDDDEDEDDDALTVGDEPTKRGSQRPDIGLLCQGCGRPFTRLGEPMIVWRAHGVAMRFHAGCQFQDPRPRPDYADAWLRARFEGDYRRRPPRQDPAPGELVRAGSVAVDRPDGSRCLSAPLPASSYAALIAHSTVRDPIENRDCPICMHPLFDDDDDQRLVVRLPCSSCHVFHEACLRPWFRRCSLCPTCRANLAPAAANLVSRDDDDVQSHQRRRPRTTPHHLRLRPSPSSFSEMRTSSRSSPLRPDHRPLLRSR